MKKILMIAIAITCMGIAGCKTTPSAEKMYATSYAVGTASGMVAAETKMDDKSRETVIEIVKTLRNATPEEGKTFREAWTAVAAQYTEEMVKVGKITTTQATLIVGGVTIAGTGLDYVFEAYPKAKTYEELVAAAVSGFSDGFLATFKPSNEAVKSLMRVKFDKKAYDRLKKEFNISK